MRLLHFRNDHDCGLAVKCQARFVRGGNRSFYGRQHLPLWHPATHCAGHTKGSEGHERIETMSKDFNFESGLEPDRFELAAPPTYHFDVDRREFFRFLGAGVLIVCVLKDARALQESGAAGQGAQGASLPKEIGAWLHIGENGSVTVYTGKVEVGQNIRTSLTQAVAEELHVPVSAIQ